MLRFLREGRHVPGIFITDAQITVGVIIDLLILAARIIAPEECRDQLKHPLRM